MIEKYFVPGYTYNPQIKKVEAVKESDKSLWFKSTRFGKEVLQSVRKRTEYDNYFDTWEEAHAFLLKKCEIKVEGTKKSYDNARSLLGQVKALNKGLIEDGETKK